MTLTRKVRPPSHRGATVALLVVIGMAALVGCQSYASPTTMPAPSTQSVQRFVEYLASDELEGRGVGTRGLDLAANYIAGYYGGLGLKPAPGQQNFFQEFVLSTVNGIEPKTSLIINGRAYTAGTDYNPIAVSAEKPFDAPLVFVGYAIAGATDAAGNAYDDFAGVDVKGKIAVALRFEPHDDKGTSRLSKDGFSEHAALLAKAKAAADRGAVALLIVHPPAHHGPEMLTPLSRRGNDSPATIPIIHVHRQLVEDALKAAGAKPLVALQNSIDSTFKPASFELAKSSASGDIALKRSVDHLKNVTAYLPGSGPHRDEFIVVGAHYDHLGRGGFGSRSPRSNEVHHGADDNASGTAAVMEVARMAAQAGALDRSVLFVNFTAEEQGLLGSMYWVEHPPVPLSKIAAMINLDMVGRVKDGVLLVGGTGTSPGFDAMIKREDDRSPLKLKPIWRNGFAPSDCTSFVTKKIPVLFFFSGMHEDYHRPTDVASKINFVGEVDTINLTGRVLLELSALSKIKYEQVAGSEPSTQPSDPSLRTGGASLGVIPDYSADDSAGGGVKISGVSADSAAQKAGFAAGDTIVQFGTRRIENLMDLTDVLNTAKPGESVKVVVKRGTETLTLTPTLTQRRGG